MQLYIPVALEKACINFTSLPGKFDVSAPLAKDHLKIV
jgi:hypothetical protein